MPSKMDNSKEKEMVVHSTMRSHVQCMGSVTARDTKSYETGADKLFSHSGTTPKRKPLKTLTHPLPLSLSNRFFWLALYCQPALWVALGIVAIQSPKWLSLVVIALILTITNTVAFSRCDKFSQASTLASSAMYGSGIARSVAGGLMGRLWSR